MGVTISLRMDGQGHATPSIPAPNPIISAASKMHVFPLSKSIITDQQTDRLIDGWTDGWTDRQMDKQTDGRTVGQTEALINLRVHD